MKLKKEHVYNLPWNHYDIADSTIMELSIGPKLAQEFLNKQEFHQSYKEVLNVIRFISFKSTPHLISDHQRNF